MRGNRIYKIDRNGKKRRVFWVFGLKIRFKGKNSTVILHEPCVRFRHCVARLGDDCRIEFQSSNTKLKYMELDASPLNNSIDIGHNLLPGPNTSIRANREPGLHIKLGDNCLFGPGSKIAASDGHAIYDINTGEVLNRSKDIVVGNHVWMTTGITIFKGVEIADNTVIASNSVVTKSCLIPNAIYGGTPARLLKENINWNYDYPTDGDKFDVSQNI
ncbi:MAG: acyltransferase [Lentisphaerae bacterium]|nr:acyltransferase [Lentisphaerota bacterium]